MDIEVRAQEILDTLTLGQKIALGSGSDFWHTKALDEAGVPALKMSDGPSGLRCQPDAGDMLGLNESLPAVCFPAAVTTACTFDPELVERVGRAIGEEALAQGVGVVLGPGANIKRSPLCGRSFEYFSEDPLLAGELAAAWIRGVEATGAGASLKHFACNNQEYLRFMSDSILEERTLREIYLAPFERAVREGRPSTVMSAYNLVNGVHCSSNHTLLTDILREEWGFDGCVVTDWGGMRDRTEGYAAGCDLSMPGGTATGEAEALAAVQAGELDAAAVDRSALRVIKLMLRAQEAFDTAHEPVDMQAHHDLAREVACRGAVLMKNEGGLLPLAGVNPTRVAFIGDMACNPRYQGAGSSHINPWKLVTPMEACPEALFAQGCDEAGDTTDALIAEAVAAAQAAEAAVVFAGLPASYESEGFDRSSLTMPAGQVRLIHAVVEANPKTVVVLMAGAVVEMPWFEDVAAVLYMGLAGEAVGEAARDLLFGAAEPAGRLAETWPLAFRDCPCSPWYAASPSHVSYRDAYYVEGVYVGYRYFETADVPVRLPFGFGLSYAPVAIEGVRVERTGDAACEVFVRVANPSLERASSDVVQVYVAPAERVGYRPTRELRAFAAVQLAAGETRELRFSLDARDFSVWHNDAWRVAGGAYLLQVGVNARKIACEAPVEVAGEELVLDDVPAWYLDPQGAPSLEDFEGLLGRKIPLKPSARRGTYTLENSVIDLAQTSTIARIMCFFMKKAVAARCEGPADDTNPEYRIQIASSVGSSLASLRITSGMRGYLFEGLLEIANGHLLRGLRLMMKKAPDVK